MDKDRSVERTRKAIEGADAASLGQAEPPRSAPPGANVDPSEHRVPGAGFDDHPATEAKPWSSSLAARDPQAGVGNDAPDGQPEEDPLTGTEERGRSE